MHGDSSIERHKIHLLLRLKAKRGYVTGLLQLWVSVSKPLAFWIENSVTRPSALQSGISKLLSGLVHPHLHSGCSMNFYSLPGELRVTSHIFYQYSHDLPEFQKYQFHDIFWLSHGVPLKQTKNTPNASAGGMDSALCVRCRTIIAGVAWGFRGMTGIHEKFRDGNFTKMIFSSPENWKSHLFEKEHHLSKATCLLWILFCKIVLVSGRAQEFKSTENLAAQVFENESCTLSQPKQFGSLDIWDLMTNIGSSDLQEFGALGGSSGDQLFH